MVFTLELLHQQKNNDTQTQKYHCDILNQRQLLSPDAGLIAVWLNMFFLHIHNYSPLFLVFQEYGTQLMRRLSRRLDPKPLSQGQQESQYGEDCRDDPGNRIGYSVNGLDSILSSFYQLELSCNFFDLFHCILL
mgnify:CR=1 FL=1